MTERWTLAGKTAFVTGGTRGIGRAIVEAFTAWDVEVFFNARNENEVVELETKLCSAGHHVTGIVADVCIPADRERICRTVMQRTSSMDILVNNAGTNIRKSTLDYNTEEIHRIIDTNLGAAYEITRLFHPMLKLADQSSVIMMSSVAGLGHLRTGSVYGLTKAALIQLSKNLAVEWAPDGIRVNAIAPWYINTEFASEVMSQTDYYQSVLDHTPMGRIGEPHEVSDAVCFLCMPAAAYITGQCLAVDGGFSVDMF